MAEEQVQPPPPQPDFLSGLIDAITTGAQHSYGQVTDDLGSLIQGMYNPGTATRMMEVAGGLPIDKLIAQLQRSPLVQNIMRKGGEVFHGSPHIFGEVDVKKTNPGSLVGPGHYVTDNPTIANTYAEGATALNAAAGSPGAGALEKIAQNMKPNIRSYQMAPHNTLDTSIPLPKGDFSRIVKALQEAEFVQKAGKHGTITPAMQQANAVANFTGSVLPDVSPSQQAWSTLASMFGNEKANDLLKKAGFQSITYPGGRVLGGEQHQATNVLDPSILSNLVIQYLRGQKPPLQGK
jgi:hypothetical protein